MLKWYRFDFDAFIFKNKFAFCLVQFIKLQLICKCSSTVMQVHFDNFLQALWRKRYEQLVEDEYGQYFKVARLFARIIARPALMRELSRVGIHSRTLMEWVLRIMANLLRPDELGPAEAAYKAAAAIVRLYPNA